MRSEGHVDLRRAVPLFMSEIEQFGGAERSMLALGHWLHAHGVPVYLLTYIDRAGMERHANFPLPKVELRPAGGVRAKLGALRAHYAGVPQGAPSPITSGYQPALHAALARIGRFHCLMHDTPSLFSEPATRSAGQRLRFALSNRAIGWSIRRERGCMIVTSEYLQRECEKDFHLTPAIARMGGLAGHEFRLRPVAGELRMLSVCRIEANKRVDWMLESLAELERLDKPLSSLVDWRLDLAGRGTLLESLQRRAAELGIGRRVHFHGFVPDDELERLYDGAHIFLMPAVQGYGIPAIEALQRGIPVLLHRESGVSDLLLDTPWAAVIRDGPEKMTTALTRLLDVVLQDGLRDIPLPELPTEDAWAERVARSCDYV